MSIDRDTVIRTARLARISLRDDEIDAAVMYLQQTLEWMDVLQSLPGDVTKVAAHPEEMSNVFRADKPIRSYERDAILKQAGHHDGEFFRVPKVVD